MSPSSRSSSSRAEEGEELEDVRMDAKSREAKRESCAERGRCGGKRMGKAFRRNLYRVTKLPMTSQ